MSARHLQQPAPISPSEYKWLGTNIVTALAVLPRGSEAGILETNPQGKDEPPGKQPNGLHSTLQNVLVDTDPVHTGTERSPAPSNRATLLSERSDEGACGGDATSKPPINALMDDIPDRFLYAEGILADFDGSHIPVLIRPETRTDHLNVSAVREILEAYEQGSPIKALVKAKFPEGDFQYHLITYLRNRARICLSRQKIDGLVFVLMKAYVTGVREWCAAALDVFISQVRRNHTTHAESGEAADDHQEGMPTLECQHSFLEEAAVYQRRARAKPPLRSGPNHINEWRIHKENFRATYHVRPSSSTSARKSDTLWMQEELRFVSDFLRSSSPFNFLDEAPDIARILKSFGAPRPLISLLQNLCLCPEDIAEYERVEKPVQGADDTGLQEISTTPVVDRIDLPRSTCYMAYPLDVLDSWFTPNRFRHLLAVPPFLQLGYGSEDCGMEAINKMIELYKCEEYDKALSVMDQEFHGAEQFHEHFFSCLKRAMQSYGVPKLSKGVRNRKARNRCDLGTPLGEYLKMYAEGLQQWCACMHRDLARSFDDALDDAYLSDTAKSHNFIKALSEIEPTYTQGVNWLIHQIDLSRMGRVLPPPQISLELPLWLQELRESIYILVWLMQEMPWDCFLSFRKQLAQLVRRVDRGTRGFSFLANILESLSFTERDVGEYKKFHAKINSLASAQDVFIREISCSCGDPRHTPCTIN